MGLKIEAREVSGKAEEREGHSNSKEAFGPGAEHACVPVCCVGVGQVQNSHHGEGIMSRCKSASPDWGVGRGLG